MNDRSVSSVKPYLILAGCTAIVLFILYFRIIQSDNRLIVRHPKGIMGTSCTFAVQSESLNNEQVNEALQKAESVIRNIEAKMSNWIEMSEISRFNRGQTTKLSNETRTVLTNAYKGYQETNGAFDITCRPLIELWNQHGESGKMPTEDEINKARQESSWDQFEWENSTIIRKGESARVDLGGLAKGYAIDKAIEILQKKGMTSGMVDIGGDLRYFTTSGTEPLIVNIKHPFEEGVIAQLEIMDAAVCTSGNYARYIEIEGKRFSHIIDPRSGRPSDIVPSVTIFAEDALQGDIWATAISVLGVEGLPLLPEGVEAFLILGNQEHTTFICTKEFASKLVDPVPQKIQIWQENN